MKKDKKLTKLAKNSPAEIIKAAVTGNTDLDKLEKLLKLQREWEADQAKKAYHKAMATFKADPPKIDKDRTVKYKDVKYNHASLYNVTEKINEALSKCGLSAAWTTKQNGQIFVTCKITHELGHSEETTLHAPADSTGSKNAIQAIGSTISYLQRYTLLSLTGLATYGQDDDAQSIEYITNEQAHGLTDLIIQKDVNYDRFCKAYGIDAVERLPANRYEEALKALKAKKAVSKLL